MGGSHTSSVLGNPQQASIGLPAAVPPGEGLGSGPGPWLGEAPLEDPETGDLSEENSTPLPLQTDPQGSGQADFLRSDSIHTRARAHMGLFIELIPKPVK